MHVVVYPIAAVVAWMAFFYKVLDLSKDWDNRGKRAVCVALFFPALAFTIATPAIFAPIDRAVGFPNLAKLWVHGSLVIFSATVQRMLLLWTYPVDEARPKVRRRVIWAGLVLVTMTVLLILAPVDRPTPDFTQTYATTRWVAEYLLVYLIAVGIGLAEISRLCWSYAKVAPRPWLVRGLNTTAVGAAIGIGYCLTKAVYVIGRNLGVNLDVVGASSPAFAALGAILVCAGLTMPAWGDRVSSLRATARRYRSYWALYPLWRAMFEAAPNIALDESSARARTRWSTQDLQFRLFRREVEIQDGRMALREYLDPAVARAAQERASQDGLSEDEASAVAEAAMLKVALRAREANETPVGPPSPQVAVAVSEETRWLVMVAQAFVHSPIVRAGVAEAGEGEPSQSAATL